MTGPSWLIDSKRFATKIKNASETVDPSRFKWVSNPTKACPRCNHVIDNSDVVQEWPGLPHGVKFDPSDQELLWHLLAKSGKGVAKSHPFINEFIPTVDEDDGICYTHPQKLPGVKQDGSVSHFFHRTFKAYNTGTRKRRKIHSDDLGGDVRWHKTGKTKPVTIDGIHVGCKKIMVLYMSTTKGGKPEKTNWVMHQYHLGTGEDEKDGEFVVSKIFHQQQLKPGDNKGGQDLMVEIVEASVVTPVEPVQQLKPGDSKGGQDLTTVEIVEASVLTPVEPVQQIKPGDNKAGQDLTTVEIVVTRVEPVLPHNVLISPTPEHHAAAAAANMQHALQMSYQVTGDHETTTDENGGARKSELEKIDDEDKHTTEENTKWWEGESQFLLDSQQLAEGIAICDEFLLSQSQSSCGGGVEEEAQRCKPCLSDYARIGVADLKKDLEECQNLSSHVVDPHTNIELDAPSDMRLSQLEFGSQDSFHFPDVVQE